MNQTENLAGRNRGMKRIVTVKLTTTALLMAVNIVFSSFGVPVPGGHLYLNDIIIVLAALLLDPFCAFMVGGVGAFIGDMLFYPAPMFVSLAVHGIQAVVISVIFHKTLKHHPRQATVIGAILGAVIMVVGYTLGRAYVYSTPAYAVLKLPFQILQAGVGAVVGPLLYWKAGLGKLFLKMMPPMN